MVCSVFGFINIVFPYYKIFLLHPIDIGGPCRSKITLMISGTIVAPRDPKAWRGLNQCKWLYFHGVNHLTVDGGGRIDGMDKNGGQNLAKSTPQIHAGQLQRLVALRNVEKNTDLVIHYYLCRLLAE